jgi:hypothetical protein
VPVAARVVGGPDAEVSSTLRPGSLAFFRGGSAAFQVFSDVFITQKFSREGRTLYGEDEHDVSVHDRGIQYQYRELRRTAKEHGVELPASSIELPDYGPSFSEKLATSHQRTNLHGDVTLRGDRSGAGQ